MWEKTKVWEMGRVILLLWNFTHHQKNHKIVGLGRSESRPNNNSSEACGYVVNDLWMSHNWWCPFPLALEQVGKEASKIRAWREWWRKVEGNTGEAAGWCTYQIDRDGYKSEIPGSNKGRSTSLKHFRTFYTLFLSICLFMIAKTWKKSKHPLTDKWTKKIWYSHTWKGILFSLKK